MTDDAGWLAGAMLLAVSAASAASDAPTIPVQALASPPTIDGDGRDWADVPGTTVALRATRADSAVAIDSVLVKAGVHGDHVHLYLQWRDPQRDDAHKDWVWDEAQGKYVSSARLEDRLAVQFEMSGDYTTDWFSGNSFTADMWHWKASRSNPLGLAHDKQTIVSTSKQLRAYRGESPGGAPVYLARPADAGDLLYRSKRYRARVADSMPKYVLTEDPAGSVADVAASGVWADGAWHLEMRRKLRTGHDDDVVFEPGKAVRGGIAIFERSENDDHVVSDTLVFQF